MIHFVPDGAEICVLRMYIYVCMIYRARVHVRRPLVYMTGGLSQQIRIVLITGLYLREIGRASRVCAFSEKNYRLV